MQTQLVDWFSVPLSKKERLKLPGTCQERMATFSSHEVHGTVESSPWNLRQGILWRRKHADADACGVEEGWEVAGCGFFGQLLDACIGCRNRLL